MNLRVSRALAVAPLLWLSAAVASAAEFEKFVFDSADVVVVVEIKKALAAPLIKKFVPEFVPSALLKSAPIPDEKAQKLVADKDFMALVDEIGLGAERLAIVGSTKGNGKQAIAVLEGKFDDKNLEKGLNAAAKASGAELKKYDIDGAHLYEIKEKDTVWLAHFDNSLILGPSEELVKDAIAVAAGKKKWSPGAGVTAQIAKAGADKTLWMAGFEGSKAVGFHGGFTVTEDLDLDVTVDAKDEDAAKMLEQAASGGLEQAAGFGAAVPPLGEVLKTIKVSRTGASINIKAKATGAQLENIGKELPKLLLQG